MAGRLVTSTLNDDTGVLATQNGMTGIAKAWVNFNGTGTVAITSSFNVSSITDNGTGDYTVNFTTAMPNAYYSINGCARGQTGIPNGGAVVLKFGQTKTTGAIRIGVLGFGSTSIITDDSADVSVSVFSS
jgi:hypothetical protein